MKSPYVSELQPNQAIVATFLVQYKDIRQKKTGEPYLSLILGDRTGEIDAKMWDNVPEVMDTFDRDDFLKVRGLLQVYQNRLQLTIHKLQKQTDTDVDFTSRGHEQDRECTPGAPKLRNDGESVAVWQHEIANHERVVVAPRGHQPALTVRRNIDDVPCFGQTLLQVRPCFGFILDH